MGTFELPSPHGKETSLITDTPETPISCWVLHMGCLTSHTAPDVHPGQVAAMQVQICQVGAVNYDLKEVYITFKFGSKIMLTEVEILEATQ